MYLYSNIEEIMKIIVEEEVKIVFTSAGNWKTWLLSKANGINCSCSKQFCFALKSQEAGVDAVVAEGFEAGGHNGRKKPRHSH
jgi:enoyl-[acyl-carrier protein] reductase II